MSGFELHIISITTILLFCYSTPQKSAHWHGRLLCFVFTFLLWMSISYNVFLHSIFLYHIHYTNTLCGEVKAASVTSDTSIIDSSQFSIFHRQHCTNVSIQLLCFMLLVNRQRDRFKQTCARKPLPFSVQSCLKDLKEFQC